MWFLHFVSDQQFRRVESGILCYQVMIRRNVGDQGSASGKLMVEHGLARGETDTFGATERAHDEDELLVDYSVRNGRIRKRVDGNRRRGRPSIRCGASVAGLHGDLVRHMVLGRGGGSNQESEREGKQAGSGHWNSPLVC